MWRPTAGQVRTSALSHCWGTDQPHKTVRANEAAHKRGIDVASLPQTIQDAIRVTRALHLRWIRSDSLCIIQDSDADQARELGDMDHVYTNANLNISATRLKAVGEGHDIMREYFADDGIPHAVKHQSTKPVDVAAVLVVVCKTGAAVA